MLSVEAYLSSLPNGLDSHPSCTVKASVLSAVRERQRQAWDDTVGRWPILSSLQTLPPPNTWIPEVAYNALVLGIAEGNGWTHTDLTQLGRDAMHDINRSAVYGFLLKMLTSKMMVKGTASRWNVFHAGTTLTSSFNDDDVLQMRLTFPHGLFDEALAHYYRGVFQAVLDDARDPGQVGPPKVTDTAAVWQVRLQR